MGWLEKLRKDNRNRELTANKKRIIMMTFAIIEEKLIDVTNDGKNFQSWKDCQKYERKS